MIKKLLSRFAYNAVRFFSRFNDCQSRMSRENFLYTKSFLFITFASVKVINMIIPSAVWPLANTYLNMMNNNTYLLLVSKYLFLLAYCSTNLAFLSLIIRRLHDTNRSGWYCTMVFSSPLLFLVTNDDKQTPIWSQIIIFGIPLWLIYLTYFKKGDSSSNRFGEPDQ